MAVDRTLSGFQNVPIKNEDYTTAFSIENMYKDVNICMNMAKESGLKLQGRKRCKAGI